MAKILIVDDEPPTIRMLSTFLAMMGHETIDALSSRQARDRLAYLMPDAVLLDIMLPDMSGIDLCRELRAESTTATLPIIILSAHVPPREQEAAEAGASAYLSKPVKLETLRSTLAGLGIADARRQ